MPTRNVFLVRLYDVPTHRFLNPRFTVYFHRQTGAVTHQFCSRHDEDEERNRPETHHQTGVRRARDRLLRRAEEDERPDVAGFEGVRAEILRRQDDQY